MSSRAAGRIVGSFALAASFGLAACSQQAGDRCQVQSDCECGLICVLPAGGTPAIGGTCEAPVTPDIGPPDLTPEDLAIGRDLESID